MVTKVEKKPKSLLGVRTILVAQRTPWQSTMAGSGRLGRGGRPVRETFQPEMLWGALPLNETLLASILVGKWRKGRLPKLWCVVKQ
ncbi:hypothetical protein J6590_081733 [Homalodisca vitripennis]|nr:hypothetical protein J6590_081733 [Homalodisca vitripennis]